MLEKVSMKSTQQILRFYFVTEGTHFGISLSETRLFLESHSLECHETGQKNTLGNKELDYLKRKTLAEEILDIPVSINKG